MYAFVHMCEGNLFRYVWKGTRIDFREADPRGG